MVERPVPDKLLSCTIVVCISVLIGKALAEDIPRYAEATLTVHAEQVNRLQIIAHRNFADPSPVSDDSMRWAYEPVVAGRHR
jgi:hypothetical protein